jgi:hypothetical protein
MKTTQAWGWLAAGVLALGLNGIYHDGGAAWAHRALAPVVDRIEARTGPILALAVGRADLFIAKTESAAARTETASCRLSTAMARVQSKIARTEGGFAQFEAMSAREEAAMARVEANRARIEAEVARVRFTPVAFDAMKIPVICPRVRVNIPHVSIPRVPVVNVPEVHVNLSAGPV